MFERCFIAFVDKNVSNDVQQVVLTAAGELFHVRAEFEVTDPKTALSDPLVHNQESELKWITVKSRSIDDAEDAKKYILACFSPQCKCTEVVVDELVQIIQDGYGLWWRTLEQQFKVRLDLPNSDKIMSDGETNPDTPFQLSIQGLEEGVAYASSYISELNMNLKCPPIIDDKIDDDSIRSEFFEEISTIRPLNAKNYVSYNPFVLRTLLKWIYFIKGVKPANDDYVLNLMPKQDESIILLEKQEDPNDLIELDDVDEAEVANLNNSIEVVNIDDSVIVQPPNENVDGTPQSSNLTLKNIERHCEYSDSPSTSLYTSFSESSESKKRSAGARTPCQIFEEIYAQHGIKIKSQKSKRHKRSRSKSPVNKKDGLKNEKQTSDSAARNRTPSPQIIHRGPSQQPPQTPDLEYSMLRPVVIDGSNVAMHHGRHTVFSCRGILITCQYFIKRGHWVVSFVPQHRQTANPNNPRRPIKDQYLLEWMESKGLVIFTPSRHIYTEDGRRRITPYDDNMIVQFAHIQGGVIVSKDMYRDVLASCPQWQETIQKRVLMYSFVNDVLMVTVDPMGKGGPTLDAFLRFQPGEVVPQTYKTLDAESCRSLMHDIEEVLNAPPPPPGEYQPRWNPNYGGYRHMFRSNFDENRFLISGSSVNEPQQPVPIGISQNNQNRFSRVDWFANQGTRNFPNNPAFGANDRWQAAGAFGSRSRSHSCHRGNDNGDGGNNRRPEPSLSPTFPNGFLVGPPLPPTQTNSSSDNDAGIIDTRRDHLVRKLSEIFPRDLISRVMKKHKDVTDLQVLSNLITDDMNSST